MAGDRTKLIESAQRHVAKGQFAKAIAVYRKITEKDPSDVRVWLKLGDLYGRKGARRDASEAYEKVAKHYAEKGFYLKAVAIYKQVLRIDPSRIDTCLDLAAMYEQLGLMGDALTAYDQAAALLVRSEKIDDALELLAKMVALDPTSLPVRIRKAEALSQAGRKDEAADEFETANKMLEEQGRWDDYIKVGERLLFHRPTDLGVSQRLAELYLDRDQPRRALAKLQACFQANPRHVPTLELLARVFVELEQEEKAASVFREVARIHQQANQLEDQARALKRVIELAPDDAEARRALAAFSPPSRAVAVPRAPTPPPPAAPAPSHRVQTSQAPPHRVSAPPRLAPSLRAHPPRPSAPHPQGPPNLPPSNHSAAPRPSPGPPPHSPHKAPPLPVDVEKDARIARLFTEAEVLTRYGLHEKVAKQLQKVVDLEPDHLEANERLKEVYLASGKHDEARLVLEKLAQILVEYNQLEQANSYRRQAEELTNRPTGPSQANDLEQSKESERREKVSLEPLEDAVELDTSNADGGDIFFIDEESGEESVSSSMPGKPRRPSFPGNRPASQGVAGSSKRASSPAFDLPIPDAIDKTRTSWDVSTREVSDAPSGAGTYAGGPVTDPAPMDSTTARRGDVEDILDESEFFVVQGLIDEAKATLQDALATFPGHPILLERIDEVEEMLEKQERNSKDLFVERHSAPAMDLAEELGQGFEVELENLGADELDVDSVFDQFREGAAEQFAVDDTDTHFDLGIAYKEMGLLEDAIREFEISMKSRERECLSLTMIGMCFVARGEIAEAVRHFKQGLYAEIKTAQEELGLYYELGQAYEKLGDPGEALYYFKKVHRSAPQFRGVRDKMRELEKIAPPSPSTFRPPAEGS